MTQNHLGFKPAFWFGEAGRLHLNVFSTVRDEKLFDGLCTSINRLNSSIVLLNKAYI